MLTPEQEVLVANWRAHGFSLPVDDPEAFYSDEYWARDRLRPYPVVAPGGAVQVREYIPPSPEWLAFGPILEALWPLLGGKPQALLDVGCGCGSLVGHARRLGVNARGIDISAHAIEHPVPDALGHLIQGDVLTAKLEPAEVVTATDLMEHIHEPAVPRLALRLLQLAERHLFLCICVARRPEEEWSHVPGEPVPLERAWIAVSGHVTIHQHAWWVDAFREAAQHTGHRVNWEAMHRFAQWWTLHPAMSQVASWSPANILVMSRESR